MKISVVNAAISVMIQLLLCNTEAAKDEVLKYASGDQAEALSHGLQNIKYSSLVQKTSKFSKDNLDISEKEMHDHIITDDPTDIRLNQNFTLIPCKDRNKVIYMKNNTAINESIIIKVCSTRKKTNEKNNFRNKSHQISIRKKRDLNETVADDKGNHEELPKPEKLLWGGPVQHYRQDLRIPRPHSMGSIHRQHLPGYQNRLPPLDSSRFHLDTDTHFKTFLTESDHYKDSTRQSNEFQSPVTSITKQFHQNDPYSSYPQTPRFPEVPARPSQPFYPLPSLSSIGEAGASLLHLLNPMNLFRPYVPPPIPNTGGHLPPNTNQFPYNTNSLRELRNPSRPVTYELGQTAWPHEEETEDDGTFRDSGKIIYEIIKDENQHDYGHEYKEDSSLRDDIYVGKDGNLYIKESSHNKGNEKSNSHFDLYDKELMFSMSNDEKTMSSHKRYEEQDIQEINSHEDKYNMFLKNHNMNEDAPNVFYTKYRDFFSDDQDFFDLNTLDHQDRPTNIPYGSLSDNNRPKLSIQREVPHGWAPPPQGRINYPSYSYIPRPVVLPTRYRSMPRRNIPVPNPVIPTNPRYPKQNPSNSQVINPFLHRPSPKGYPINDDFSLLLSSNRKTTRFDDFESKRMHSNNHSGTRKISNSHGFYPGNGFFEADFPTLVQMAPLKQSKEHLALNGTSLTEAQNATIPAPSQ